MSIHSLGLSGSRSPVRENEKEKEQEVIEKTEIAAEAVFPKEGERSPIRMVSLEDFESSSSSSSSSSSLQQIDRVVSIRTQIRSGLIEEIESEVPAVDIMESLQANQSNPTYLNNGIKTIRIFKLVEQLYQRFQEGDKECYKELIAFNERNNLGFHEDSYVDRKTGVFSPDLFMECAKYTADTLRYVYEDACKRKILPVFFQLALSDGGCFQARSESIAQYRELLDRPDLNKEFLICLIKIYSARHNNHQTPVNLDKFIEFIKTKTELSLEDFGVNSQNPSEDKVVMELTQRGLFTSSSKEILSAEIFDLFSAWLLDNANPNRQSFARYIKKNVRLFGGQRLGDKAIGRLIDQFIETYKHFDVGQYLQSNNPGPRNPNHQK